VRCVSRSSLPPSLSCLSGIVPLKLVCRFFHFRPVDCSLVAQLFFSTHVILPISRGSAIQVLEPIARMKVFEQAWTTTKLDTPTPSSRGLLAPLGRHKELTSATIVQNHIRCRSSHSQTSFRTAVMHNVNRDQQISSRLCRLANYSHNDLLAPPSSISGFPDLKTPNHTVSPLLSPRLPASEIIRPILSWVWAIFVFRFLPCISASSTQACCNTTLRNKQAISRGLHGMASSPVL